MLPDNPFTVATVDPAEEDGNVLPFPSDAALCTAARLRRPPLSSSLHAASDYSALVKRADEATTLLKVLCNENRLTIFQLLVGREMTVGEISRLTSKPQKRRVDEPGEVAQGLTCAVQAAG